MLLFWGVLFVGLRLTRWEVKNVGRVLKMQGGKVIKLEDAKGWNVVRWEDTKGGKVFHRTKNTIEKRIYIYSSQETISDRLN